MSWRNWFSRKPEEQTLDADLRKRIRVSFEEASRDEEHFPSSIDPRIFHVQLIQRYFGPLAGKRVLDVGCGKGRFARILASGHPTAMVCGLDLAHSMLKFAPQEVRVCAGSMTELPFAADAFDAAYATESLEHAVEIERAVAEICRVVKPGGRIVIIDKNADQAGRLETPEWERWFGRKELERLLKRHCRRVSSQFISYWEDVKPDGLFIAWTAEK